MGEKSVQIKNHFTNHIHNILCHVAFGFEGYSGEWKVSQPFIDEFVARYRYGRLRKPLNSNAIMKERNLMKVMEGKG